MDTVDRRRELFDRLVELVLAYEADLDGEWGCGHTISQITAGECPDRTPLTIEALRLIAELRS
ncbi:hypothetical protein AB0E83_24745 [Streptomyces sp. NPDC035033]|uniref:hypothetical protein n=1 Tax=Streptomyces sp. NPDC035033 TaxID=3155368 RepID=UPI0033E9E717